MANPNAPFGLRPVRHHSGVTWNGKATPYYVPASDSTALMIGDPVVHVGDSNDNEINGFPPGSLLEVTRATVGDTPGTGTFITGVVVGVLPVTDESPIYRAASTERILMVCDDPDVVFHIRDDGTGTPSADWAGLNAVLKAGTGSTVTGRSAFTMDGGGTDGPDADASNQLLILGLARLMDNEIGDYAIWEVMINAHTKRTPALGIA